MCEKIYTANVFVIFLKSESRFRKISKTSLGHRYSGPYWLRTSFGGTRETLAPHPVAAAASKAWHHALEWVKAQASERRRLSAGAAISVLDGAGGGAAQLVALCGPATASLNNTML